MIKARELKEIAEETIAVAKKQKELDEYFKQIKLKETLREVALKGKFCYNFVMEYEQNLVPALQKYFRDLGYGFAFQLSDKYPTDKVLVILAWDEAE